MRPITLISVARLVLPHLSTLSHKLHDFRKEDIEYQMRVLIFLQLLPEIVHFLKRTQRDVLNVLTSSCKVLVFFTRL